LDEEKLKFAVWLKKMVLAQHKNAQFVVAGKKRSNAVHLQKRV
jgi:hypothetical protein